MKKNSDYLFTEDQMRAGMGLILLNIEGLLHDATILLTSGSSARAFGLYLIAVEEYGKALLLQENRIKPRSPGIHKLSSRVFRDHNLKFERARRELPEHSQNFLEGVVIRNNTQTGVATIVYQVSSKSSKPNVKNHLL